eukprot:gnl/TRDRNA2_/TRDRNA2_167301_c2_seq1.p1 gnl/TRDRNA2_/TRDRNA2_167301_c2~~gnl/TRDRNA2_/TRDRNA2_167301_c2_seq1.p1  ORF type:complete len:173 (+),score=22.86 gnl/TRDRNA2_/TRDRNA2_167301_c2_seq1:111-629(+)
MVKGVLDNTWNSIHMEMIKKEEQVRWDHSATIDFRTKFLQRRGERSLDALGVTPRDKDSPFRRSAALRFLEEKVGLDKDLPPSSPRPTTREVLYRGVSHDGGGRALYLQRRNAHSVNERYGRPLTETHLYGNTPVGPGGYQASPNAKKPIIQKSFFRTQGVQTYKDPPVMCT